jgi:hypothetical protein
MKLALAGGGEVRVLETSNSEGQIVPRTHIVLVVPMTHADLALFTWASSEAT